MPAPASENAAAPALLPPAPRRPLWRLLWPVLLATTVFFASGQSKLATPVHFLHMDKLVHALTFGLMATLVVRVFFVPRHPVRSAWGAIAAVSLYGLFDELRQSFTPGREVDVADWVADTGGAMLAVCLYTLLPPWRRMLEYVPCGAPRPAAAPSGIAPAAASGDAGSPSAR
jgi:VanZ family protein